MPALLSKLAVPAALVAAALLVAPSAFAKGPFEVCGASGCAVLAPETQLPVRLGVDAATATLAPVAPAPYFVVRFQDFPDALVYWVPSASVLRLAPQGRPAAWVAATAAEAELLRAKTEGLRPYPSPVQVLAAVDGVKARGAATYLRLYTVGAPATSAAGAGGWLPIWMLGGRSPWNDGRNALFVSRRGGFLKRDGQLVRIPAALAQRIRARLPLT